MSAIVARFAGVCAAGCGEPIEPGEEIVVVDDSFVHVDCEGEALGGSSRPITPVCSQCFMHKPCPCDDGQAAA